MQNSIGSTEPILHAEAVNRYVLTIQSNQRMHHTSEDALSEIVDVEGLKVVRSELPLIITATRSAVTEAMNRIGSWCVIEEEIIYGHSKANMTK